MEPVIAKVCRLRLYFFIAVQISQVALHIIHTLTISCMLQKQHNHDSRLKLSKTKFPYPGLP